MLEVSCFSAALTFCRIDPIGVVVFWHTGAAELKDRVHLSAGQGHDATDPTHKGLLVGLEELEHHTELIHGGRCGGSLVRVEFISVTETAGGSLKSISPKKCQKHADLFLLHYGTHHSPLFPLYWMKD